jgi:succinoglycan biosynthesis protein ExoM
METGRVQMTSIDVCIATYKRPQLLKKLLESLSCQQTNGKFSYSVIVIDNDLSRTAEAVVKAFQNDGLKCFYDVEPEQNISLARNRSVRHSTGDFIAIIDDDDSVNEKWLLTLYETLIAYNADVVNGPVIPIFPDGTPDYIKRNRLSTPPNLPTGSFEYSCYTSNTMFRRKAIDRFDPPFHPDFGRTGGEDILFFKNLRKEGCKFVWCNEAWVFESVLAARAKWSWILKRFFRNGNITYRIADESDRNVLASILHLVGFLKLLITLPFFTLAGIFFRSMKLRSLKLLEEIAFHLGFLSCIANFSYEQYGSKQKKLKSANVSRIPS